MDELTAEFGIAYEVMTANIDEKAIRFKDPRDLVLALGRAKRDAIMAKISDQPVPRPRAVDGPFLITCDQVVVHQENILEKPETAEECRKFIRYACICALY